MDQLDTKIKKLIFVLERNFKNLAGELSETQKEKVSQAIETIKEQLQKESIDSAKEKQNLLLNLTKLMRDIFGRYFEHETLEFLIHKISEIISNYL